MLTQFSPLNLDLIEEGRFRLSVEEDLRRASAAILRHAERYGQAAEKAKARVKVTIDLVCADADDGAYVIKASSRIEVPARPAMLSQAVAGEDDNGRSAVLVRRSGSGRDDPRQKVFTTEDGRQVDPETGEIVGEAQKEG